MAAGSTGRSSTSTAGRTTTKPARRMPRHRPGKAASARSGVADWPQVQQNQTGVYCGLQSRIVAGKRGTSDGAASGSQRHAQGVLLPAIPAPPGRAGWRSSPAPRARHRSAEVFRLMQLTNRYPSMGRFRPRRAQDAATAMPAKWGDVPFRSTEQDEKHQKNRNCAKACFAKQPERASADRGIDQFHDALPFFLVRSAYRMNEDRSSKSCSHGAAAV